MEKQHRQIKLFTLCLYLLFAATNRLSSHSLLFEHVCCIDPLLKVEIFDIKHRKTAAAKYV